MKINIHRPLLLTSSWKSSNQTIFSVFVLWFCQKTLGISLRPREREMDIFFSSSEKIKKKQHKTVPNKVIRSKPLVRINYGFRSEVCVHSDFVKYMARFWENFSPKTHRLVVVTHQWCHYWASNILNMPSGVELKDQSSLNVLSGFISHLTVVICAAVCLCLTLHHINAPILLGASVYSIVYVLFD